jgi:predicted nucleic acid-binding protein
MTGDALVDTNVLVYAYDQSEPQKQQRALDVLRRLVHGGGQLSAQVLGEFFRAVTTKLRPRVPPSDAYTQVAALTRAWRVLPVTPLVALEAARGVRDHGLAYWDAQIWATARLNQAGTVLSEDFADGRVIEGVVFRDPFARAFDPTRR